VEFEALTSLDLLTVLLRYEEDVDTLTEGMRSTGPAEKVTMMEYGSTFKDTVRDAVAAHLTVYHDFLSTMTEDGLKSMQAGVYPSHEQFDKFLRHFLTEVEIHGPVSPFNKRKWDCAAHDCVRTNIVRPALRLTW
jgi:hypothetical protein